MRNESKFGPKYHKYRQQNDFLGLADDWFLVMARNIVKLDTVTVEIVEYSYTKLIAFPVIGLGMGWASSSSVGPPHIVVGLTRRPSDTSAGNSASGPEILLTLPTDQVRELPLLGTAVNTDGLHAVLFAESGGTAVGEGPAAQPPADKVVFARVLVVRLVASSVTAAAAKTPGALRPTHGLTGTVEEVKRRPAWPTWPAGAAEKVEAKLGRGLGQSQTQHQESQAEPHGEFVARSALLLGDENVLRGVLMGNNEALRGDLLGLRLHGSHLLPIGECILCVRRHPTDPTPRTLR